MAKARSTSMSRRTVVAGLALAAAPVALAGADRASLRPSKPSLTRACMTGSAASSPSPQ